MNEKKQEVIDDIYSENSSDEYVDNKVDIEKDKDVYDEFNIERIIKETVVLESETIFKDALEKIKNDEEVMHFIMDKDPRNDKDYFFAGYKVWATQESGDLSLLTYKSRLSTFLGSFFIGSPQSQAMPFYFYYTPMDKMRSAPNHFNNVGNSSYEEDRYRLFVNRYAIYLRRKVSKWLAVVLVGVGLFMGLIGKPIVNGIKHQFAISSQVSKIDKEVDTQIESVNKSLADRKAEIKERAKDLKQKYESGSITAEEFNAQATLINNQDKKLDQAAEESITRIKASGERSVANVKGKDSDEVNSINSDMEAQLEAIKQKYNFK